MLLLQYVLLLATTSAAAASVSPNNSDTGALLKLKLVYRPVSSSDSVTDPPEAKEAEAEEQEQERKWWPQAHSSPRSWHRLPFSACWCWFTQFFLDGRWTTTSTTVVEYFLGRALRRCRPDHGLSGTHLPGSKKLSLPLMSSLRKLRDWMPPYTSTSSPLVSSKESLLLPIVLTASVFLQEYESQPVVVKEWIQRETETENGSCLLLLPHRFPFCSDSFGPISCSKYPDHFACKSASELTMCKQNSSCSKLPRNSREKKIFDSHWVPGFFNLVREAMGLWVRILGLWRSSSALYFVAMASQMQEIRKPVWNVGCGIISSMAQVLMGLFFFSLLFSP